MQFMNVQVRLPGTEHWTNKGDVKLFLWNKVAGDPAKTKGTILFVHGSSMASQPTFDLDVPGRPDSSAMEYFAKQGYDCWCVDMEGYGRSTKDRDNNAPISFGADDCYAAATYIQKLRGAAPAAASTASRRARCAPALFAERHPEMVDRLALDATVWTGEGSPTLAERRKKLPEFQSQEPPPDRPRLRAFDLQPRPSRARPRTRDRRVRGRDPEARRFACRPAPMSTCARSCRSCNPENIKVPTLIMRGQWDGIAGFDDLIEFFKRLPNPDKQFAVMPGISHASFQQKNYMLVYHILLGFFSQPAPVYRG